MSVSDSRMYKEVLDLIPQIIAASKLGLQRELDAKLYDVEHIEEERKRFQAAGSLIQGRWTIDILYAITLLGSPNYNQILRALPGINSRTLTDRLKFLEGKRVIQRTTYDTRPVHVTYQLTEFGRDFISLVLPAILYCGWPEFFKK